MPLPDYEFYTASYLGEKIPQESFARFITRAARQLERYKSMFDVRPRAGLQEPEACALCAMADAMYAFAEEDKRCRVVSASVGSVSETYAAPPELCAETIQGRHKAKSDKKTIFFIWVWFIGFTLIHFITSQR